MNLIQHSIKELTNNNFFVKTGDIDADDYTYKIASDVLELINIIQRQNHNKISIGQVLTILNALSREQKLSRSYLQDVKNGKW